LAIDDLDVNHIIFRYVQELLNKKIHFNLPALETDEVWFSLSKNCLEVEGA